MAFAATMEWDVRTTGDDNNGGGFDPVSGTPGTDYSQQNAAQVTFSDLVIDGTTNTKCTSAAHPFTSAHVGNIINIIGGTGFTVQRVQIMSVASAVATCDKSLGTLSSTGGSGYLGGSLQTIGLASSLMVSNNTVHIKAGTYTITTSILVNSSFTTTFIGYNSTHKDMGTKPLITTATNSTPLVDFNVASPGYGNFINISFSNTATTREVAIQFSVNTFAGNMPSLNVSHCIFDGVVQGVGSGRSVQFSIVHILNCEAKNFSGSEYAFQAYDKLLVTMSYIHNCYRPGSTNSGSLQWNVWVGNVITDNTYGITANQQHLICINNTIANNGNSGISYTAANGVSFVIINNILYGNTLWGVDYSARPALEMSVSDTNAFGNNGSGALGTSSTATTLATDINRITLTADPFTNAAGGDYSLNNAAGGGLLVIGTGLPQDFGGTTLSTPNVGAVQNNAGAGPSEMSYCFVG